jgi:hypothetical protein
MVRAEIAADSAVVLMCFNQEEAARVRKPRAQRSQNLTLCDNHDYHIYDYRG